MWLGSASAQDELPQPPPEVSEEVQQPIEDYSKPYYEDYHYSDSAQIDYNQKHLPSKFDKSYWETESRNISFDEATKKKKPDTKKKKDSTVQKHQPIIPGKEGSIIDNFKYVFIALAFIVLGVIIFLMIRKSGGRNRRVDSQILINFDEMDEQTLKDAKLNTPLQQSIQNGDYKTAYRIRYLQVLQMLISRNLIFYRKEKTNYEYLLELSGKGVYEPFRMLTFNFDGIWYGELMIDAKRYESLMPHFEAFELFLKNEA